MDRVSPLYRSSPSSSPKESVWALYCRSMLLWNFCVRLRNDQGGDEDKAEFALEAWAETQTIQDSLDMHVCNLNTTLLYIAREYLCKYVFGSSVHFHQVSDVRLPSVQLANDDRSDSAEVSSSSIRLSPHFSDTFRFSVQGLQSRTNPGPEFSRQQAEDWRACSLVLLTSRVAAHSSFEQYITKILW